MYPPPRLARTAFLIFRRRRPTSTLFTFPQIPPFPQNLPSLGGRKIPCAYGAGRPWTRLKPPKTPKNPIQDAHYLAFLF